MLNWWFVSQTQTATIFLLFKAVFQKEMNLTLRNKEIWYKFLSFLLVKKKKEKKGKGKRKEEKGREREEERMERRKSGKHLL